MINTIETLTKGLNNEQKQAVENPLFSCTKIVAGAGTGKTNIISKRFAKLTFDLIENNIENPTSKILVITFTDKAANEMKERIIKVLNENNLNSYGEDFWISTFHGFCNKILRKHAIEANLAPDFELAEESTLFQLYENIIKTLKNNEYKFIDNIDKLCSRLNLNPQLLDISNLKKLSSISSLENIFDDIFSIIKKIKSLGLTPEEFLQKTISSTQNFSQTVRTIPFGFSSAEEYIINWENHLKPYTDKFCIFEKETAFKGLTQKALLLTKNKTSKAQNWTAAENFPENISDFEELELYLSKVIALIYAIYQNQLEQKNIVDFDDLINKTIYILKNNKLIRLYYQKYFKHLIIDEFQDTNGSQLELIKLLLNDETPNITFVGDRKQSIYGFRYAQMENLEVLHKYIEEKYNLNFPEIKLFTNYRSSSHVLNTVNYITEEHLKLDENLTACETNQIHIENKYVKNIELSDFSCSNEKKELEATYIASEIQKLKKEEKNTHYNDFAILVKSHAQAELIEKILTKYSIPSIKKTNKSFFTNTTIKNAKAVLNLIKNPTNEIALTRILKIHFSDKELYEIKKTIDEKYFENFEIQKNKYPNFCEKVLNLIELNIKINPKLSLIYDTLKETNKNKKSNSLLQLFSTFAQKIPLFNAQTQTEAFQANINLRIFEKIISDYEQKTSFLSLTNFLEYFEKIEEDKNFELPSVLCTNIDAVQIMTIHASKGLEFPYTFVCSISNQSKKTQGHIILDLQYGKKPGFGLIITKLNEQDSPKNLVYKEIWQKPRDLNETIRLFYVAASRAKKYLNILTFKDTANSKAAFYTQNFPPFVINEEKNLSQIEIEKPQKNDIKIQNNSTPKNQTTLKNIYSQETKHKFSFSKLNTYINCPNKFLIKYKHGFPPLNNSNSGSQVGSIVHRLIYNSIVYNLNYSSQEINSLLEKYNLEPKANMSVLTSYNNFLKSKYAPSNLQNEEFVAEHNFNFTYFIDNKEIEFTGDIDLLIKNKDKTYSIIDFKTNTNIDTEKENYYNQLYLYKKALEAQNLKIKSCEILSLNNNGILESFYLENEEKIKLNFEKTLHQAIKCYENENITYFDKEKNKCKFCEYNYYCI